LIQKYLKHRRCAALKLSGLVLCPVDPIGIGPQIND
jgi:hypothetical protein